MYWDRDIAEIDGCIARLLEDRRAQVQASERAAATITECQQRLREDTAEIALLEAERDRLLA